MPRSYSIFYIYAALVFFFTSSLYTKPYAQTEKTKVTAPRWSLEWNIPKGQEAQIRKIRPNIIDDTIIQKSLNNVLDVATVNTDLWKNSSTQQILNHINDNFSNLYHVNRYKFQLIEQLLTKRPVVELYEAALKTGHAPFIESILNKQGKQNGLYTKALYLSGKDNPFVNEPIKESVELEDYPAPVLSYRKLYDTTTPPRQKLQLGEQLEQKGLIPTDTLVALYRTYSSAESGGVWGRVAMFQRADSDRTETTVNNALQFAFSNRMFQQMLRILEVADRNSTTNVRLLPHIINYSFHKIRPEYKSVLEKPHVYISANTSSYRFIKYKQYGIAVLIALDLLKRGTYTPPQDIYTALAILVLCGRQQQAKLIAQELSFNTHGLANLIKSGFSRDQ